MVRKALRLLGRVEEGITAVSVVMMFLMMTIIAFDVVMRYVLRSPISWAYDFISLYLTAGVFFLVLSEAYGHHAHVNVNIVYRHLPLRVRCVADFITSAVSLIVFAVICYVGAQRAIEAFAQHDTLAGAIAWPTWPALVLVPIGTLLVAFRLLLHGAAAVASLLTGEDLVPAPAAGVHGRGE